MKQLQVYMATGWLPQPELVGMLGYDSIRGNATFRWEYSSTWLQAHRGLTISADLQNAEGPQYGSGLLYGFLQDAMPDRWGRRLIDKRERLLAEQEGRSVRHLKDVDYLTQIDDTTRTNAIQQFEQTIFKK